MWRAVKEVENGSMTPYAIHLVWILSTGIQHPGSRGMDPRDNCYLFLFFQ